MQAKTSISDIKQNRKKYLHLSFKAHTLWVTNVYL
jgi:hypothetical protein